MVRCFEVSATKRAVGAMWVAEVGGGCSFRQSDLQPHECYVLVVLDLPRIAELHLHVSARTARDAMLSAPKLKLRETDVHIEGEDRLKVYGLGLGLG